MAIWNFPSQLWVFARKLDEVMTIHKRTEDSVAKILERIHVLETRMTHLEADRGQMITEAKAAAGIAASAVAGNFLSDVITRITRLEMRQSEAAAQLRSPEA